MRPNLPGAWPCCCPSVCRITWRESRLHQLAGLGSAALLACVVGANVHVAQQGQQVHGLSFSAWYYWARPLLQPVFIL